MAEKSVGLFGQVSTASADHPPYQKGTRCFDRIDTVKFGKNQDDIPYVAMEKTVLHVISDAWGTPRSDPAYKGDLVGDSVSQVFSFTKTQKNYTLSALRSFLKTICDVSEQQLNDAEEVNKLMLQVCGKEICGAEVEGAELIGGMYVKDTGDQPLQNVVVERKDKVKAGNRMVDGVAKPTEFINTSYVRRVLPSEVLSTIDADVLATLFPVGVIEELVKEEEEEAAE